jgi:hypothetical protein
MHSLAFKKNIIRKAFAEYLSPVWRLKKQGSIFQLCIVLPVQILLSFDGGRKFSPITTFSEHCLNGCDFGRSRGLKNLGVNESVY